MTFQWVSTCTSDGDVSNGGDECTRSPAESITRPALLIKNLSTPPGDDLMVFRGTTVVVTSPPIDPYSHGLRVVVHRSDGSVLVDATIPGGAYNSATTIGWKRNSSGSSFRYTNNSFMPLAGIKQAVVRNKSGKVKFVIKAFNTSLPVASETEVPLRGTIILTPPTSSNGQCGETAFVGRGCSFASGTSAVICK